jgi:S1-C subfamily serine protease
MGFAVPANLVAAICSDIEQYGESRQVVSLGIQMVEITENNVDALRSDPDYEIPEGVTAGFYIIDVVPDSSVDGYIEVDDIVTQVGEIEIGRTTDFSAQFQQYKVGDVIDITVIRNGNTLVLEDIELKAKPTETE